MIRTNYLATDGLNHTAENLQTTIYLNHNVIKINTELNLKSN